MLVDSASPTITRRREPATMRPAGAQAASACLWGRPLQQGGLGYKSWLPDIPEQGPKVVVSDYSSPSKEGDHGQGKSRTMEGKRLPKQPKQSPPTLLKHTGHWRYCFHFLKTFNSCDQTLKTVSCYTFGVCIHHPSEITVWNLENVWLHPKLKCTQKN